MMEILLRRAYSAEDLFEWNCGLCEVPFTPSSVYADIMGVDDSICEDCLAYLHGRQPELFPSVEQLRELAAAYPTPVFENDKAAERMELTDIDEAARLWHECRLWTRRPPPGQGIPA